MLATTTPINNSIKIAFHNNPIVFLTEIDSLNPFILNTKPAMAATKTNEIEKLLT
mgnify:CR=1 FL=1